MQRQRVVERGREDDRARRQFAAIGEAQQGAQLAHEARVEDVVGRISRRSIAAILAAVDSPVIFISTDFVTISISSLKYC